MSTLQTISRKIKVKEAITTTSFEIEYNYEHEEGVIPEMIVARAKAPLAEGQEKGLMVDLSFYPNTSNLQVTCHNKPDPFDAAVINEVTGPISDIIAGIEGTAV